MLSCPNAKLRIAQRHLDRLRVHVQIYSSSVIPRYHHKVNAVPFGLTLEQADGLSNNFLGISLLKNILTVPKIEGLYFPLWVIQSDGSFGDQQANESNALLYPGHNYLPLSILLHRISPGKTPVKELTPSLVVHPDKIRVTCLPYTLSPSRNLDIVSNSIETQTKYFENSNFTAYPVLFPFYLIRIDVEDRQYSIIIPGDGDQAKSPPGVPMIWIEGFKEEEEEESNNVAGALKSLGRQILETMVGRDDLKIPLNSSFDADFLKLFTPRRCDFSSYPPMFGLKDVNSPELQERLLKVQDAYSKIKKADKIDWDRSVIQPYPLNTLEKKR